MVPLRYCLVLASFLYSSVSVFLKFVSSKADLFVSWALA